VAKAELKRWDFRCRRNVVRVSQERTLGETIPDSRSCRAKTSSTKWDVTTQIFFYQFHLQMLSIESDETTQSSDNVCCGVLDLVLITTVVLGAVQSKSFFANGSQTNFSAESNKLFTKLQQQIEHILHKLLQSNPHVTSHSRYSKPRPTPYCKVLPPGEFEEKLKRSPKNI